MKPGLIENLKVCFKRYPRIYYYIVWFLGPMLYKDRSYRLLFNMLPENERIISLGSGPLKISERVTDIDISMHANIDLRADVAMLPLKNSSVAGIINIALLEHTDNPQAVVAEICRVLKPGGYVYTVTPFMYGFHASPSDYYRWTKEGIKKLFAGFEEVKFGVHSGPTSALASILQEWLSMIFSFQNKYLYQLLWPIFMIAVSPLKILDFYLSLHPEAHKISASNYYICRKPQNKDL